METADVSALAAARADWADRRLAPNSGTRWVTPIIFMVMGSALKLPLVGTLTGPSSSIGDCQAPAGPMR